MLLHAGCIKTLPSVSQSMHCPILSQSKPSPIQEKAKIRAALPDFPVHQVRRSWAMDFKAQRQWSLESEDVAFPSRVWKTWKTCRVEELNAKEVFQ